MRHFNVGLLVLALGVGMTSTAAAQARRTRAARTPHTESTAVGLDFGAFMPRASQMNSSPTFDGWYEYYVTPRVSVRGAFGWAQPDFRSGSPDSMRQTSLRLDADYNWEGGAWHPFVGAGFGAYFLQFRNNGGAVGPTETKPGFNVGGGIEYFVNRSVSIKGEARYFDIAKARGIDPSGLAFTVGLKTYF